MSVPGNLLIVRNDRLGDAILALPTIPILKFKYPDAGIIFLASPPAAPLMKCVRGIDAVISAWDHDRHDISSELREHNIQTAYCFRPTYFNARSLKRAGIPSRIGTSRRWYSYLFNKRVPVGRRESNRHEVDLNIELIDALALGGKPSFPEFDFPADEIDHTESLLADAGFQGKGKLVIIHPGSGGSAKEWHPRYFKELADRLQHELSAQVIITGGKNETGICSQVAGDRHPNLAGKTSIIALAAIIQQADLLVSNSTGPLHLAVAAGRKVIGLYPPVKDCLPSRWGPYGHLDWAVIPDVPLCRKCHPGEFSACSCMEKITPAMILAKCVDIFETSS